MLKNSEPKCIGDVVSLQRGTTYQSALLGRPGPKLLGLGSIARNGGFKAGELKTYGGSCDPRILVYPGDLFVSLKDVTQSADLLGAIARVPRKIAVGRLTQDTVALKFRRNDVPSDYVYWLLRTPDYREYCRAHATGTTNLGLAREDFFSYPVPPLTQRRHAIMTALTALDDKIELNSRMNETLEAMARAIFKDWFVDFGPTRAKMEGRAPYLGQDIWSLFPDRLDDEGRPEGWTRSSLIALCHLKRGYDLPTAQRTPGPHPIVSSSGVSGYHAQAMADAPGVVTGRYGTIGQVFFVTKDFWPLNTALYVKDFKGNSRRFVWHTLSGLDFQQFSDKGAVPGVNRNDLHQSPVVIPPSPVQDAFDEAVSPLWRQALLNEKETETLAATRDLLLPKLMSGELRIRDAERVVGDFV